MNQQPDLFGESPRIHIEGNPLLAQIANHILEIARRHPEVLDGDNVGEIDRKLMIYVWLDDGLRNLIPNDDQRATITLWLRSKACVDPDAIGRARRYLVERDLMRISQTAVKNAEQHRERIARSVKR